jgi:hypothetical protein
MPFASDMDASLTAPEFRLLAACCRWPFSAQRTETTRALAADVGDWQSFLSLVQRHRVGGLVHNALLTADISIPAWVAERLATWAQEIARKNLPMAVESAALHRLLDVANIPALSIKGASLAERIYGAQTVKQARDIDVLVAPDQALKAIAWLEGHGYVLSRPTDKLSPRQRRAIVRYGREVELVHPARWHFVELTWRLTYNMQLLRGLDARSPAQQIALPDGTMLRTLQDDDLFAYLCVHGATHAWFRLKWLADLNALVASEDDAALMHRYRHAQACGAGLCAGQALLLCQEVLDRRLPGALEEELRASRRIGALVSIALQAMAASAREVRADPGSVMVARGVASQFLLGRGWRFFMTQCRLQLVGIADVVRMPLPAPLHFLYPLLRLPFWLWRRGTWAKNARLANSP